MASMMVSVTFSATRAEELKYKDGMLQVLVRAVPEILKNYDPQTGRFGKGIWICTDQNVIYPLAAAYAYRHEANPYHRDRELLDVIMKAGDALIADANEQGQWVFRKKDGSEWGMIHMPWTYSRWMRAFALIRDDMPTDRREHWERALVRGYDGISRTQLRRVHNIPAHHAMGLYAAGKALNHPEWCERAADFLMKVADEQAEGGYWSENLGPVVGYNFVYVDALGCYYGMSRDERVLPALAKAAAFHFHFTYPDGSRVETVDERNPYHRGVESGNLGFTFTPIGRAHLRRQWSHLGEGKVSADLAASLLLYGEEGPITQGLEEDSDHEFLLVEGGEDRAAVIRKGPWFVCLSAYTAPIPKSRWIQDRQNLISIYHDRTGLIIGGGNTKLQPAWSNFTVGDAALLTHTPGDTAPDFLPRGELYHVPSEAKLARQDPGLDLKYGTETCSVRVRIRDERTLEYELTATVGSDLPVNAHLTLIPHLGGTVEGGGGKEVLGEAAMVWSAEELGGMLAHRGYRLRLPETATLHWPALPHNPYRKDGRATPEEGRIEIRIPFDREHARHVVVVEIPE